MAVYNSSVGSNQDDSDITIINPSIIHEHNDDHVNNTYVPIITRLRQANNSSESRQTINSSPVTNNDKDPNTNGKHDYIFVDHNPNETAQQLEQVLRHYIRDLKQETKTQIDCDQQLVTRLMDLIRPAYRNDQKKMIALDQLMGEISSLHDKRHIENKEKIEQLRSEIYQLQKMLCTTKSESMIYNDGIKDNSMPNTIHRGDSTNEYDQWTEIEDDAKKLHEIVQSQRNQINEIVTLISETVTASASIDPTNVPGEHSEDTPTDKQPSPASETHFINSLLQKIRNITGQQPQSQPELVTTNLPQETTLENTSPGISPTQSLATLTLTSLNAPVVNHTPQIEEPVNEQVRRVESVPEPPHQPSNISLSSPTQEPKKCPVCNHEFEANSDDMEMYDHIEHCLFPSRTEIQPKDYECPNCARKYPGNAEIDYLQHLSDCYNNDM